MHVVYYYVDTSNIYEDFSYFAKASNNKMKKKYDRIAQKHFNE